ncbi:LexA family transcriptional regulator [Variovorax sp. AFSI2.2]|uniref:LexA family transcriptional regulator n=1 Tax=Variovorax sp. AFSI2.2 TaxID=3384160 RepID=UPI003EBAC35B
MSRLLDYARKKTKGAAHQVSDFAALQVLLQVSSATLTNWKSRGMSKEGAIRAERELGCSANWLLTGEGDEDAAAKHRPPAAKSGGTPETSELYLPGFEALSIPVLAQLASMGPGEDQLHDEVVVGRLTVSPQWVSRTIKPLTKMENLRFIHGYGDSMDPTFADGDVLLVDIGVTAPKIDGVYVMEANDRIYIKRVRQRIDGTFEISSDNPTVKTVDVLDGSRPVEVRGRVVWAWNGKKL